MKRILFALFCFTALAAQAQTGGVVSGRVESASGEPMVAATVQLMSDSRLVKTAVTDKNGGYSIEKVKPGKYTISITAVGFVKSVQDVTVATGVTDAGTVKLSDKPTALGEVVVTANKPFIEQKLDKMVVNVDASPSNAGATAMEVLEKSPGVSVDNDGNISLKGKQGVIVMMDGKPTQLSAADLANVLRNMPASSLEQIEIMTNPSAKYDAAGNSGILNIKTKKGKIRGSNGSIAVGTTMGLFENKEGKTETTHKPNVSVNYNYRKNKINLFSNFVYNYREGRGNLDIVSNYYRDGKQIDSINNVSTFFRFRNNNYTLKLGLDYQPDKFNTFGIVLNGFMFDGRPTPTTFTNFTNKQGVVFSRLHSKTRNAINWDNFSGNLNWRHLFDTAGTEITFDLDYSKYSTASNQLLQTGFFDGDFNQTADSMFLKGHLPSEIDIYSMKSDFVHTFSKGLKLESGIKSSFVKSDNLVDYQRLTPMGWRPDSRNNHFIYEENINAAYLNVSGKSGKWNLQAGLRLENTNTKGTQVANNSVVKQNYVSLFPSVFANYPLSEKHSLTVNASRRLQRPNYQDLNPFTFFLDSLSYRQGNPYLTPQFSYNFELIHSYKNKVITTLNYTITDDVISQIINRQRGSNNEIIGFLTSDNIAKYSNLGLSISAPVKIAKKWNANLYGVAYRNHFEGTYISIETGVATVEDLDLEYTSFMLNMNNTFNFSKKWTGELSGWYRYKSIEQLSLSYPMGSMSIGLARNQLFKGKGTLRLTVRDPFNWQRYKGHTKYGTVDIMIRNRWDNRQYGVNFSYRFGKQSGQQRKRTTGVEEEQQRVGAGG